LTTTTFSSAEFITTTNSLGSTTTTAPATILSTFTSTNSQGGIITVTQIGVNPTLNSGYNTNSKPSAFFQNTGAVAGVFVLVGLVLTSIFLWILFAVRRHHKTRRQELDSEVSATLAAGGFTRKPLDNDDNPRGSPFGASDLEMVQRDGPSSGSARRSSGYFDGGVYGRQSRSSLGGSNPFADYILPPGAREGYVPAPTASPPLNADGWRGPMNREEMGPRHRASNSMSQEPLLALHHRSGSESPPMNRGAIINLDPPPPVPPPRNPNRLAKNAEPGDVYGSNTLSPTGHATAISERRSAASFSVYSSDGTGDDRLDPDLPMRLRPSDALSVSTNNMRDEEDYSRPILGIRNLSDAEQESARER